MQVRLTLTPGYRLKIARVSRMSELADRALTSLASVGGSAAFLGTASPSRASPAG